MKPHNELIESNIGWVGKIPSHWKLTKLKYYCTVNNGKEIENEIENSISGAIPVYGSGGIFKYTDKPLYTGEAVMFGRKGTLGKPIYVNDAFWTVDTMYYLTFGQELNAKFNYYQLLAFDWEPFITRTALPSIVATDIINANFPFPPLKEQEKIVEYLDSVINTLDQIIQNKKQIIIDLNKYKNAIITEAVTRGLCPQSPMKDIDTKGIKKIPQHWSMSKLKYVVSCNDEVLPEDTSKDTTINYVEISDVDYIEGITGSTNYSFSNAPSRARRVARPKDVIISTVRTYLKAIAQITAPDLTVSTGFAVLRAKGIDADFLSYAVKSNAFIEEVIANSVGVSYPAITASELINISIPIPPESEQIEISEYLKQKNNLIDQYIKEVEKQVNNLISYKTSIIYEAVTGKIDLSN